MIFLSDSVIFSALCPGPWRLPGGSRHSLNRGGLGGGAPPSELALALVTLGWLACCARPWLGLACLAGLASNNDRPLRRPAATSLPLLQTISVQGMSAARGTRNVGCLPAASRAGPVPGHRSRRTQGPVPRRPEADFWGVWGWSPPVFRGVWGGLGGRSFPGDLG